MTVCTASLFYWIYDHAQQDFGAAIITASDRTLTDTGLGIGYQGPRFKGSVLPDKQLVLVSDDITTHSAISRQLTAIIDPHEIMTTLEIANVVGRLLREYRAQEAAHLYLAPLNLDQDSFLKHQRTMDPSLVIELANQLQGHTIDVEAMVVGCDGQKDANHISY